MAEHFHTGFVDTNNSATAILYSGVWDQVANNFGGAATVGAPFGTASYLTFSQNGGGLGRPLRSNAQHLFVGFRFTRNQNPANATAILFALVDNVSTQVSVCIDANSSIGIYRSGTTLVTSTPNYVVPGIGLSWDYFEFEINISNTAGLFNVWKNGNAVLTSATNLNLRNTANNYANRFVLGSLGSNGNCAMSVTDLYCIDDQAGNGPTARVGDSRMFGLSPTGAGNNTDWTPSTGSNWQNVDDIPSNEDTDYNSSSTVGNKDRYAFADLPGSLTGTIMSVSHRYRARKDDGGIRSIAGNIRSGASETAGTTNGLAVTYATFEDTIWTDPNGAGALTIAVVNGLQAGPDVIS